MMNLFKILPLLGIVACSDFPEIPYESRNSSNIQYGQPIIDTRTDASGYTGKEYKTVIINEQTWMAENLNYRIIPSLMTGNVDYKCIDNCSEYGVLYNWEAAKNVACPDGWHLPSRAEWDQLVDYLGGSTEAGAKLKATSGWNSDGNGSDTHGFAALPGGWYDQKLSDYRFEGSYGAWWTSTASNDDNDEAYGVLMLCKNTNIEGTLVNKDEVRNTKDNKLTMYSSVRCIKGN
jgi:uncharacterized protein (TIGR02145 family)